MINQPLFNIGCLGSVSDGKSTLIEVLTGIKTQKHSIEKTRNITIKQGYGNMKIWKNNDEYITTSCDKKLDYELVNHISFVDCPGHQNYILTTLSSINLMNGVIIIIAVDQPIANKPLLLQHLIAVKVSKIDKIIICLNKIDLVEKYTIISRKHELDQLLEKLDIKPYIIIPTCFNKKIGIEYVTNSIIQLFNPSDKNYIDNENPIFQISRSFDINKPGTILFSNNESINMKGGVIGGTLIKGKLKKGDLIEVKPGFISNNVEYKSLITKIIEIKTENIVLDEIIPGGLVGILTDIDSYYTKNDYLNGHLLGLVNNLPAIHNEILLNVNIFSTFDYIWKPKINDIITLQIGISSVTSTIINIKKNIISFKLNKPTCIIDKQNIILCYNINNILKIVGDAIL